MIRVYILAFLIALLASYVLTPYVKKIAFKIGALDKPNKRKVHHKVMPRLGGLAIYCGFILAVLCTMHISKDILGMLLGGTVIMIIGVLDDKYQLPAKVKLLGQIIAACVLDSFRY
jgi:UDP-GlcNAc:undecaprenyl-phosphate GlcNAc-1-phosphate transferase